MRERYREGHGQRRVALMPLCENCPDAQAPFWRKRYDNNCYLSTRPASVISIAALTARLVLK